MSGIHKDKRGLGEFNTHKENKKENKNRVNYIRTDGKRV